MQVRFDRFWYALVTRIRRRATEGYLDNEAINRLFGWGEAA